jgi:hypothetical protein
MHQHIDRAKFLNRFFDRAARFGRLLNIRLDQQTFAPEMLDFLPRALRFLIQTPGRQRHVHAAFRQRNRRRRANPARPTRHQGHFILQNHRRSLPFSFVFDEGSPVRHKSQSMNAPGKPCPKCGATLDPHPIFARRSLCPHCASEYSTKWFGADVVVAIFKGLALLVLVGVILASVAFAGCLFVNRHK